MKLEVYDFRKPGRLTSDIEQRIASWLRSGLALLPAKWAKHLPIHVEMSLDVIQTASPIDALAQMPDTVVCHSVSDSAINSLVAFPRNLSLALLAAMMGDSPTELPPDRFLTPVEESLWSFLLQQVMHVFHEAWPGDDPVQFAITAAVAQPKRSKLLAPDATLLVLSFPISGPFGQSNWLWLIPQQLLIERLARSGQDSERRPNVRPTLENLIGEMPIEVSVRLGDTELPVSQLTRLRAGDLVILNQRVSEPLEACIAGQTRFHVWPGRVGPRRAFQIDSLVDF